MSAELPEHPPFLYGTAWKEDGTRRLTQMALKHGFRGIDTANQRKHYFEAAVGEGIADAMDRGLVTREDIFVQTKFTHLRGQDERLPYDPKAPVSEQVQQSFASSQEHLRMDYIDSLVLHGPTVRKGLAAADLDAWKAMRPCTTRAWSGISGSVMSRWNSCRCSKRLPGSNRASPRSVATRRGTGTVTCAISAPPIASSIRGSRC